MTREEHLAWAKQRALEYVDNGDLPTAVSSMVSDLGQHPETATPALAMLSLDGMLAAAHGDAAGVRRWIEGFN